MSLSNTFWNRVEQELPAHTLPKDAESRKAIFRLAWALNLETAVDINCWDNRAQLLSIASALGHVEGIDSPLSLNVVMVLYDLTLEAIEEDRYHVCVCCGKRVPWTLDNSQCCSDVCKREMLWEDGYR